MCFNVLIHISSNHIVSVVLLLSVGLMLLLFPTNADLCINCNLHRSLSDENGLLEMMQFKVRVRCSGPSHR